MLGAIAYEIIRNLDIWKTHFQKKNKFVATSQRITIPKFASKRKRLKNKHSSTPTASQRDELLQRLRTSKPFCKSSS